MKGHLPLAAWPVSGDQTKKERLSDWVIDIIRQSWRSSTESILLQYMVTMDSWSLERNADPLLAPLSDVLEFLCKHFDAGKNTALLTL